jgi:hypothetical protein
MCECGARFPLGNLRLYVNIWVLKNAGVGVKAKGAAREEMS